MEAASRAFASRFQLGVQTAPHQQQQHQQYQHQQHQHGPVASAALLHPFQQPASSGRRAICFSVVNDTEDEELLVSVTRREDAATLESCIPPGRCTFITEPASFEEYRSQLLKIGDQLFELRFAENNGYHFVELPDPEASRPSRYAIVQEEPRQMLHHGAVYLRCHVVKAYGPEA